MINDITIGVFGGSGFYDLMDNPQEIEVETEHGKPSSKIMIGVIAGKKVAFLPRHGKGHIYPPHKVPYKANIAAFKKLGVKKIIAPCACGSLNVNVKRGDFVILDQFVDRTSGRDDTYYHGPKTVHISTANPYCENLRNIAVNACKTIGVNTHKNGTVVVIQGPRFSTKAESLWFQNQGWEVINMTQYPEAVLAREAEICYCGIALITDYDTGVQGEDGKPVDPVNLDEVIKVFNENNDKVKKVLFEMIKNLDTNADCVCHHSLTGAAMN